MGDKFRPGHGRPRSKKSRKRWRQHHTGLAPQDEQRYLRDMRYHGPINLTPDENDARPS